MQSGLHDLIMLLSFNDDSSKDFSKVVETRPDGIEQKGTKATKIGEEARAKTQRRKVFNADRRI